MLSRIGFVLVLSLCACALRSTAQTLVTDIPVSGSPYGVAVNPHNNRIYVSLSTATGPAVAVINGATNTLMTTVSTPLGSQFIAANLVTDRVYSAGCDFSTTGVCTVTVIDGTSNTVIATIPLNGSNGIGLQGITIDPIRNVIYVSDDMNYEVAVINGDTNAVTYINTGNTEMLGLSFDFATNLIVGTPSGAVVDLIAGATHQIKQVPVGTINEDVAVDSFTSRAYVTDNAGTTLGVVDLRKGRVVTTIPVGSAPSWVCADYLSNLVFVIVGNSVVVVDGEINKATGSIAFNSSYLSDVDVNPATRLVYVSDLTNSVVHVLTE